MSPTKDDKPEITRTDFIALCIAAYRTMAPILLAPLLVLLLFYILVMLW